MLCSLGRDPVLRLRVPLIETSYKHTGLAVKVTVIVVMLTQQEGETSKPAAVHAY